MALTDDHPIKITATEYKPVGQGDFELWLGKEAELAKAAAAPKLDDNENESTDRYNALFEEPHNHSDVSQSDKAWGEKPDMKGGRQEPFHNNDATFHAANEERTQLSKRVLDKFPGSAAVEQALLAKNLTHAASGEFETHSVMLHDKSKLASLSDRVKKLVG